MPSFLSRVGQATRHVIGLEQRNVLPPDAIFTKGYGVQALFNPDESLRVYGDNVWLYRSVLAIAMEIAQIELRLQTRSKNGDIHIIDSHQAIETLQMPQVIKGGKSILTGMDLKIVTIMHMMLTGEAFWALDKRLNASNAPTKIDILTPALMRVRFDEQSEMIEYRYRLPNKEIVYDPFDVVHFKIPDPNNWVRGHAPTQAIRYALDAHLEADKFGYKTLANGAVPSGLLSTDKKIDPEERKKYLAQWKQMFGGGDNAGKTAFLPEGIGYESVQQTNAELQFIESKNQNRDEILGAYGVGPEIFGKTESQTRANAEAAIFVFMRFGVQPFNVKFVDTLNTDYLPAFPNVKGAKFAYDDPVPDNMDEKRANADSLFLGGALTPNERRKMFGMEPLHLPGMDIPYMNFNMNPVGEPPVDAGSGAPPPSDKVKPSAQ